MSSRYANRVYAGRSFPNQSLRSATKLAARAFESNCVSGGVLILESKRGDPVELDFPLRQRHIADATGLTPVHVSKVLSEFRRS
jgi:CRP-like cAMP-binding protein